MKQKKIYSKNQSKNRPTKPVERKQKAWWILAIKFVVLLAIAVSVVIFTDKKGYFEPDQSNEHPAKKWNAFYEFTENDTVDVVLVGNSHCFSGINPENLSTALGANCFVLASPATTIMDSYYCLKEALMRTCPKVAVIETYGINNSVNHNLKANIVSEQFRSFNARKNLPMKIASTPVLFSPEYYIQAWSKSIRNHDFIFRDRDQLEKNIELSKERHKKKNDELYLGRFVRFTTGIEDSIITKYDSLGAPVDGAKWSVNKENVRYVNKIVELCKQHGVIPVFITIPMYYKHIKNYPAWKKAVASAIEPTGAAWFDLQEQYDTVLFDRNCFENTFNENQHMTYRGSVRGAYKVAHFLVDSLKIDFPKRSATKHWNDMFYGEGGYFENYPSRETDTTHVLICKNRHFRNVELSDCIMTKGDKSNNVLLKIKKKGKGEKPANKVRMLASVNYHNQRIITYLD